MKMYVILALLLLSLPVFAENVSINSTKNETINSTDVNESNVGALPGEFSYGFKRFFENVDKFFTFNKAEAAKKSAAYGKLRATEAHVLSGKAQKLSSEGKTTEANETVKLVEKTLEDQEKEDSDAATKIEQAVADGSAKESDVEQVETQLKHNIAVLQRVYEKVPEKARESILRNINRSIENQERHMEKMNEKREMKNSTKTEGNETKPNWNETRKYPDKNESKSNESKKMEDNKKPENKDSDDETTKGRN